MMFAVFVANIDDACNHVAPQEQKTEMIVALHFHTTQGELLMSFQDVVFLPSRASFPPHFLRIVVDVKALGPPHV